MKKVFLVTLLVPTLRFSTLAHAVPVSGHGAWETTLLARDFDGNPTTIEGYSDKVLNTTWLADTTAAGTIMNWDDADAWAEALNINGITVWRLPFVVPTSEDSAYSGSDIGYNKPTTSGLPPYPAVTVYSEMATVFYDTIGNLPLFDTSWNPQPGYGLSNTGRFDNLLSSDYWSGTVFSDVLEGDFYFSSVDQGLTGIFHLSMFGQFKMVI